MNKRMKKIAIVDTTFSRVNMGHIACNTLSSFQTTFAIEIGRPVELDIARVTVPGFKDLAVACLILLEQQDCDMALALGWVGKEDIDERCGHEAALAIGQAQLMSRKHILHIFVHETEATHLATLEAREKHLHGIAVNRVEEHAKNAVRMLFEPQTMVNRAGGGFRQGGEDVGTILI
jgi:riboflavin synthase